MSTYDLQAERTLALTLVASPQAFDYCDGLTSAHFADDLARRIFDAVENLLVCGKPVSAVAVQAEMAAAGKGASVIPAWNKGKTVPAEDAGPLAARVREMWARREIGSLASRLADVAEAKGARVALDAMSELQARVQFGGGRARSMGELTLEFMAELQRDMADPAARVAYETGYSLYDKHTGGLRPGVLTVLAARPGVGKSSFVMGMAAHLARTGVPVGLFWLEDDWRDAVRRYHQARNYVPAEQLRGSPVRAVQAMNTAAARGHEEMARIHVDDTHGLTVSDIAARMRRMAREHGVRVFFADHLGEMRVERDDRWGDRHDLSLGRAARIFRDTAKELKAAPVLCSQMNRQIERRGDGTPRMADLDGSGQVEQAARVIAFLAQPKNEKGEPTGEFIVDLAKNTNGRPGEITLRWCAERMTVEN